jgi:septal ring factor EnvC (AmiA/AmiB activator)
VSSVPRHSEEELRQQWAFLDALVDRQAASLKSGVQDPEEDDLTAPMVAANPSYLEEISTLTQRVSTLEDERTALLRRIDLAEQARMAAESARAAAETARQAAERALAEERSRGQPDSRPEAASPSPSAPAAPPAPPQPLPQGSGVPAQSGAIGPKATSAKPRRKSWWQRIRE